MSLYISPSEPRDQHVVSAMLLRRWTCDGVIIALNLETGQQRERSPRSEGFVADFIRQGAAVSEGRWGDVESRMAKTFDRIDNRTILGDRNAEGIVKDFIALHFARSRTTQETYRRALRRQLERIAADPASPANRPELLDQLFTQVTGLAPAGSEARQMAREAYAEMIDARLGEGGPLFAAQVHEEFEKMRARLTRHGLHFGYAMESEFLIGDDPLQTADSETGRVGILSGARIGEADFLGMPLGPGVVVAAGRGSEYIELDDSAADRLNRIQVISAHAKVYTRPGASLEEAIRHHRATRSSG